MNKFKFIGIVFTVIGSVLLITGWRFDIDFGSLLGNLLVLASAISYAISSIVAKNTISKVKPFLFVGLGMIAGALILIANSIVLQFIGVESIGVVMDFDLETWAILAYLTIGPGLIALFAWYYVLEHMQVSRQTFFVYLVPIFGIFFSWLVVNDTLSWEQAFFTAVIIFGVVISQLKPKKLKDLPKDKQPPKYFGP
jgi:drug/metabolite transporter (DMT)-like permease